MQISLVASHSAEGIHNSGVTYLIYFYVGMWVSFVIAIIYVICKFYIYIKLRKNHNLDGARKTLRQILIATTILVIIFMAQKSILDLYS